MPKKSKPPKPYPDFPLTPHNNGQWCKKIKGNLYYFGTWDDPAGALAEYEKSIADPHFTAQAAITLMDLCNAFMTHKEEQASAGEILEATWSEYDRVCKRLMKILGKTLPLENLGPAHFQYLRAELGKEIAAATTLKNEITKLRVLFAWAYDAGHVEQPLRYREALKRPPLRLMREARNTTEKLLFKQKEICALLEHASGFMKPAIYLGINAGLGNRDVCEVTWESIHGDWLDFPRPKNAVKRRAWLWPETVKALEDWRKESPESLWVCCGERGQQLGQGKSNNTPIGHLMEPIIEAAEVAKAGRGFYTLRHTYRTVADAVNDQPAIMMTMGHADQSISATYRHKISDKRLKAVAEFVRKWFKAGKTA